MKTVILAGGTGTRLWPMSRDLKPKQFHTFVGNRTMLQSAYDRVSFLKPADIFIATNSQYIKLVKKQLPQFPDDQLIIEPSLRDTGPCICYAAHILAQRGYEDETMAIIYADALIQKADEFKKALLFANEHVEKHDVLAVIAVRAKYANPHLGYIRIGHLVAESRDTFDIYQLDKFVEKPDVTTAEKFLLSYKYLWNTGLYMWKVKTILEKFKKYSPEIFEAIVKKDSYETAPKISVDYAVMEKVEPSSVHVIPAELGWNDIGNWAALHEELAASAKENVSVGEHVAINTEGSIVFGNKNKVVVTSGVKDLIIVDTDEALLVMHKEKAAEAKRIIEELKKRKKESYL